jgi:lysophospholipase L1-like esterase
VLLAIAAVAVLAGAVYVIADNHAPAGSRHRIAGVHTTRSTADPPASSPAAPTSTATKQSEPIVAFLGDDWTAGTGASSRDHRFTTIVSHDLQLDGRNFGADGTGYAMATSADGAYASRVAAVAAAHPDVVVVAGGRNDANDSAATVAARARSLFRRLHAKLPRATLVAIAPMWGDSARPATLRHIGVAVKHAVTAVGGTYLDLPDPIRGHPRFMADAADPDDAGYAAIAAALEPKLKPLLRP